MSAPRAPRPRSLLLPVLLFLELRAGAGRTYAVAPLPVVDPSRVSVISWRPRAFLYDQFLTEDECDHLINLGRVELKRSSVEEANSGKSKVGERPSSSVMVIEKNKDPIVAYIEEKIAAWTFLPKENGEEFQILRYKLGEAYDPHIDFFTSKDNDTHGGPRIATVLIYLTRVASGGETVFPYAKAHSHRGNHVRDVNLTECARNRVAVRPKIGTAILFFNLHPDTTTDEMSVLTGCPVLKGEKWSAVKYIRVGPLDKVYKNGGNCTDKNLSCPQWAASGECTKNPDYMVGTKELPGFCRRSCNLC